MNSARTVLKWKLESPMDSQHARERGLPDDVCYMLVYDPREPESFDRPLALAFAQWLLECVRPGEYLYGIPLLPHISQKRLRKLVDAEPCYSDTVAMGRDVVIRCGNPEAVVGLLLDFHSERTVFIFARDHRPIAETLAFLDGYAEDYASFEIPLIERLHVHGGLIFAADSHASLEVFGTEQFVGERCLAHLSRQVS